MFALFAIAFIQVAFAKDLIKDIDEENFYRVEKGQCYPYNEGAFKYVNEKGDKAEIAIYTTKDCSGTATSTKEYTSEEIKNDFSGFELKDCPKWVGYTVDAGNDANCGNKDKGVRMYFKDGCIDRQGGSFKFLIESEALRQETYKKAKCEDLDKRLEVGKCDQCVKASDEYKFVKCGAISKMIIAVLAVIFFLF